MDKYEILQTIEEEDDYSILKVKSKEDNNVYTIKQISLENLNEDDIKGVQNEAEILSKIQSEYVLKYYNSFTEDQMFNIVMEYYENGDLAYYLAKRKKKFLDENTIWKIFIQITLGLSDIHKNKILHRNIKLSNIFLKSNGDIRIGDFEQSKILNYTTKTQTIVGTPIYFCPEMWEKKPYNTKSDIWSLGCLLYELCTFEHPFKGTTKREIEKKILNEEPTPITEKNKNISSDLQKLVSNLLMKDPYQRPGCTAILKTDYVIKKAKSLGMKYPEMNLNPEKYNTHHSTNSFSKRNSINSTIDLRSPGLEKINKNEFKTLKSNLITKEFNTLDSFNDNKEKEEPKIIQNFNTINNNVININLSLHKEIASERDLKPGQTFENLPKEFIPKQYKEDEESKNDIIEPNIDTKIKTLIEDSQKLPKNEIAPIKEKNEIEESKDNTGDKNFDKEVKIIEESKDVKNGENHDNLNLITNEKEYSELINNNSNDEMQMKNKEKFSQIEKFDEDKNCDNEKEKPLIRNVQDLGNFLLNHKYIIILVVIFLAIIIFR